jgi:hypothetical protein
MSLVILALLAAILVSLTALLLLISSDWRLSLAALAIQYLGVFLLINGQWPLVMALTRLVAGWVAGAVLAMALTSLAAPMNESRDVETSESTLPRGRIAGRLQTLVGLSPGPIFYLLLNFLVWLAAFSQLNRLLTWLPALNAAQAWGGLVLVGMGLLKLCFSARPLHATLGLLTFFSGFEILYAAINAAPLTAALSAAVTLGLALAGAYLLMAPTMEAGG